MRPRRAAASSTAAWRSKVSGFGSDRRSGSGDKADKAGVFAWFGGSFFRQSGNGTTRTTREQRFEKEVFRSVLSLNVVFEIRQMLCDVTVAHENFTNRAGEVNCNRLVLTELATVIVKLR